MISWRTKAQHPGAIPLEGHPNLSEDYVELARLWVSPDRGRSYVLTGFLEGWQPELVGALLVESIHTAAVGYASRGDMTKEEALRRLLSGFDAERASLNPDTSEETH
jgi:hypothetical protein